MGRKVGDKPLQIQMSPHVLRALKFAAIKHQDKVPRDRLMDRGPMIAYIARWFLSMPEEAQLKIILLGKELSEQDDIDGATEIAEAIGLFDGTFDKLIETALTGASWDIKKPASEEGGESPGEGVDKGLKGKKRSVGVKRKPPRGE